MMLELRMSELNLEDVAVGDWVSLTREKGTRVEGTVTDVMPVLANDGELTLSVYGVPEWLLIGKGAYSLVEHRPQPKWAADSVADITVRGCWAAEPTTLRAVRRDGGWTTKNGSWDDVNVESVEVLTVVDKTKVSRDGVAKAIHGEGKPTTFDYISADCVMDYLGIGRK